MLTPGNQQQSDRTLHRSTLPLNGSQRAFCARMPGPVEPLPLPDDPALAAWSSALNDTGYWAYVVDARWRIVFATEDMRFVLADTDPFVPGQVGYHFFSAPAAQARAALLRGSHALREWRRARFAQLAPYVLSTTPGGRDELRAVVDPELADLVDGVEAHELPAALVLNRSETSFTGIPVAGTNLVFRIDAREGLLAGAGMLMKPDVGMSELAAAAAASDPGHLQRMRAVERPERRPTAILMADLEASSPLARRLSSAQYFAFGRRLVRAADRCIIDAGGIVGRHAGDGAVAFFLAETAGSESAAARACIAAARTLHNTLPDVAVRSDLSEAEIALRFGLHWGATLYIGRILTGGRSEVNALGDEMNEAARIEACATGGRTLASKALIERLNRVDAQALGLVTDHLTYTPLAELSTATDKARRDAPAVPVSDITDTRT
jgi:class 3 adenylate cyclase